MTIAWSLGVEEKFYLLWPFVLTRVARPKLIKILCGILIAEPVYRSLLTFLGHQPYTWFAFDCRLDAIVLGCLIALLAKDGWNPPKWMSHPFTPFCALSGVRAASANGYRDVSAGGDPAINGVSSRVVLEQSGLPLPRCSLVLALPLPRRDSRSLVAMDLQGISFPKQCRRLRDANGAGNRNCLSAALCGRAAISAFERSIPQAAGDPFGRAFGLSGMFIRPRHGWRPPSHGTR